jgi:O-acetyl-ADP-ribose deacetylase
LLGGGGVDGAIHRAAGPELLIECKTLKGCQTGEAKITKGYNLLAKQIVHTVGPVWGGGGLEEAGLLKKCYQNSLTIALQQGFKTIAFPAISTGVYRYPKQGAMSIALNTINEFVNKNKGIEKVILVFFSQADLELCQLIRDKSNI